MSDNTIGVLQAALDGLMERQQVISDNVANLSTPGFTASKVDFETALRSAIAAGTAPSGNPAVVTRTADPAKQNGNNVDIDGQTVGLAETELRYQAVIGAVNARFQLLRTSIEG
jgi:flagellar basal-body rod protein FlgB